MKIVILAGGSGTRLWPLSNEKTPKQFLKFIDKHSLFQKTCLRFKNFKSIDQIFVITNKNLEKITKKQIKEIGFDKKVKVILEPCKKNTIGAFLYAFKILKEKFSLKKKEKILFLPSDHLIFPNEKFLSYIEALKSIKTKKIIIFGIRPNKIETGFGYIKISEKKDSKLYVLQDFIEKPCFEKAKEFFLSEKYLWNAGMFFLTEEIFSKELKKNCQDLYTIYENSFEVFLNNFSKIPSISIDYALIEKTKNILVNILDISWSDVGSFESLYDILQKDKNSNVTKGNILTLNTKNSLIFSKKKIISTIGLDNILLIETNDAIFLAKKGESQKIKELIEKSLL